MDRKLLFSVVPGPRRWVNLPFILFLLSIIVMSGGDEDLSTMWPYLVLLPLFTVQLILPTRAGWIATLMGWVACALAPFAYERFVNGMTEFDGWFLFFWGVAPLFLILAVPPRSPSARAKPGKPVASASDRSADLRI
jgi:hypothetical protein